MRLQESGEMYLETILVLSRKSNHVRSIDICEHMGFSKPSVSRAVGLLKSGGYIAVDKDGFITLTDTGLSEANRIYERHKMLTAFLAAIGVSNDVADNDACKIEHVISDETFLAMKKHVEKLEK
ncbi:MAG: metal-dependent transcriptional regulator [Clostridia bacterium]|nr:metal-dependent transcriptional regulator [Clostridia bacterium]